MARPPEKGSLTATPSSTRGRVQRFTRKSRSRLTRLLAKVRLDELHPALFLTLTYHHGHTHRDRPPQADLNVWLQRLRRFQPEAQYIWRMEPQQRGAPHFHVMVFLPKTRPAPDLDTWTRWTAETWHAIADPTSEAHAKYGTHVRQASTFRQAMHYVSKYVAKVASYQDEALPGRRWASSRHLPVHPVQEYDLVPEQWHRCKRILRKLVSRRSASGHKYARYLRQSDSLSIILSADEMLRLVGPYRSSIVHGQILPRLVPWGESARPPTAIESLMRDGWYQKEETAPF